MTPNHFLEQLTINNNNPNMKASEEKTKEDGFPLCGSVTQKCLNKRKFHAKARNRIYVFLSLYCICCCYCHSKCYPKPYIVMDCF